MFAERVPDLASADSYFLNRLTAKGCFDWADFTASRALRFGLCIVQKVKKGDSGNLAFMVWVCVACA